MSESTVLYRLYERRLRRELSRYTVPHHIGVIVDGNRRWARESGASTVEGHRMGAAKILEFLTWCDELQIPIVTVWMLSRENLRRPAHELEPLIDIITTTGQQIRDAGYQVRLAGDIEILPERARCVLRTMAKADGSGEPDQTASANQTEPEQSDAGEPSSASQRAESQNSGPGQSASAPSRNLTVNLAIGYSGREEIVDAVRSLVRELLRDNPASAANTPEAHAEAITAGISAESIANHLYTRGQPDPDLIIRTSGEQRLSGFLLWQSVHSEFWFCETYWPGFRRVDLLRALRDYCQRERRYGA